MSRPEINSYNLTNKKVLVTGASRGIGYAISDVLLRNGAKVFGTATSIRPIDQLDNHSNFRLLECDFSDQESVNSFYARNGSDLKEIDAIVLNAGISEPATFDGDMDEWIGNWNRTIQVNATVPATLTRYVLPFWKSKESGYLVSISSRAGIRGDTGDYASYAASKGALIAFTKSIAREFGSFGIRAFTIAPGFTKTDMLDDVLPSYGEEYLTRESAIKEIMSPYEPAHLTALLISGALDHATGSVFHLNSGSFMV